MKCKLDKITITKRLALLIISCNFSIAQYACNALQNENVSLIIYYLFFLNTNNFPPISEEFI